MHRFKITLASCLGILMLRAIIPAATAADLTLGTTVIGTISEPGEQDVFTFTGAAGQRLYYDALDRDFESINVQLYSPSGGLLWNFNHSNDSDPLTLTETGTHKLIFEIGRAHV